MYFVSLCHVYQRLLNFVTEYECASALKAMKNNKSPGSDGITTEFYKIFWSEIKSYYVKSLNYSFEIGDMTVMQKQGLISLLPKKNNDLGNLNNWRLLKTYSAISNAHLFRVCKRGKMSGSCLSTLNGFGSTQLPIFLCHIGVPTFCSQNN